MQKKLPLLLSRRVQSSILLSTKSILLFLALHFFIPSNLFAQQLVTGRIIDGETRDPLPAANVQVEGTFEGTITNTDGQFSLTVETLPAQLIIRYIGYASQTVNVTAGTSTNLEILLQPVVYTLDELVVTEDDPAIRIMREVIERKKQWRAQLESYTAEAYNRFTLKNDTGIVSIIESFTETFWNPEDGTRELVKARRQTSNLDIGEVLPAAQFVANLYDDNIDIAGYNHMGVTHPKALDHYVFELLGYRQIDDALVYDISVKPRNKLKTGFVGKVAVLDEVYALLEVELMPGESFLFPPPIEAFDVTFEQQYSNYGGDFWLPVDFRSHMAIDIGLNRLLSFPTFRIEQVSRLSNYEVNAIVPDTLFAEDESIVVDSVSVAEDTLLDEEGIAVPLDRAESLAYETIDSTMTIAKAYEPKGPLARIVKVSARNDDSDDEVVLAGEEGGRKRRSLNIDFQPHIRFNRVEGLYGELGARKRVGPLSLRGLIGVSTQRTAGDFISYGAGARFFVDAARRFSLDIDYARYTDTQSHSTAALRTFNGGIVLFDGVDYFDYYRSERLTISNRIRIPDIDTRVEFGIRIEDHHQLEKKTDYDLFASNFIQRENAEISGGSYRPLFLKLKFGDEDDPLGVTGRKFLQIGVEHEFESLGGSNGASYTTLSGVAEWRFNTFFQRRLLPNVLDIKIVAHRSTEATPTQRFGYVDGRMSFYNRFGTLKTLQDRAYRSEHALGMFWEHNFKTVPFELLGMRRAAENAINVIIFGGHAKSWGAPAIYEPIQGVDSRGPLGVQASSYANNWHHEVGVSLSGLFSLFRVDFAARLDEPGFTIGLGTARIF